MTCRHAFASSLLSQLACYAIMLPRVLLAQVVPEFVPGGDVLQRWRWVMYASGLIAIMVMRPEGLFPSSARKAELHEAEEELSEEEIAAMMEQEQQEADTGS